MPQKKRRFALQRRLMVELPGLGKSGALERRPYPPGEHGLRRRKYSEYGLQLEEKQKILFHYGLREKQLRRFIKQAKKGQNSNWGESLINILERRIDNVVFRLGFAPSIPAARQMVNHGHVLVNGRKLDIPSALLKTNDKVTLKKKAYEGQTYLAAKQAPRLELPHFLSKQDSPEGEVGELTGSPSLEDIPFPFNMKYVTEYYSVRGV